MGRAMEEGVGEIGQVFLVQKLSTRCTLFRIFSSFQVHPSSVRNISAGRTITLMVGA